MEWGETDHDLEWESVLGVWDEEEEAADPGLALEDVVLADDEDVVWLAEDCFSDFLPFLASSSSSSSSPPKLVIKVTLPGCSGELSRLLEDDLEYLLG